MLHQSANMNKTEFTEFGKNANVWIYSEFNWDLVMENYGTDIPEFKSVQNEDVQDVIGSGSGPWFEQRSTEYGK